MDTGFLFCKKNVSMYPISPTCIQLFQQPPQPLPTLLPFPPTSIVRYVSGTFFHRVADDPYTAKRGNGYPWFCQVTAPRWHIGRSLGKTEEDVVHFLHILVTSLSFSKCSSKIIRPKSPTTKYNTRNGTHGRGVGVRGREVLLGQVWALLFHYTKTFALEKVKHSKSLKSRERKVTKPRDSKYPALHTALVRVVYILVVKG